MFRVKPSDGFFALARERRVGIIARVPLASGLLSGKITGQTRFAAAEHRNFNRQGEQFDRGETFSGVDLDAGLAAVEDLRPLVPPGATLAQFALRWILMFPAVTCAIPGAKRPMQAEENVAAADLAPLDQPTMDAVRAIYDRHISALVHQQW
jgi:aryl-alcohol dehydrogenase-like predicted oxidoreductase